ncbi:small ribosomal subunit protein mS25-like [Tubulanus polymorphus]|uniref:small ribosomal subunit protein mS25-like n=1 Tax=Tubulanus polymorphus TaxID=672921 RepID=UPI003DA2F9B4
MPFMRGAAPIRRTLQYLEKGSIVLKDKIKVVTISYCTSLNRKARNDGTRKFVFWHLPQLQYKNPDVQILTFRDMTPSPFITAYLENDKKILIETEGRTKEEIHNHVQLVLGKSVEKLKVEKTEETINPANFGNGFQRWCICEVPGQVPCPAFVPLPEEMTGKYKVKKYQESQES